MDQLNVCITGLPRSGTTLTCSLLNRLPDAIALHEPMKVNAFSKYGSLDKLCDVIAQFFVQTRDAIENGNPIVAKRAQVGRVARTVKRQLQKPFTLCLKHPAAFSALLPNLTSRFRCVATIRNPLSTLGSWNRMTMMAVHDGHSPAAEKLDAGIAQPLSRLADKFDRQIFLLNWYFEQYQRWLPADHIVRYEDVVATGGKCLRVVTASAAQLNQPMKNQNRKSRYGEALMRQLGEKLLQTDGAYWAFYSKASVEAVLNG
jgi:hypothetical protein